MNKKSIAHPTEIQTERLILKPVEPTFKPHIFAYLSDHEVRNQMKMPTHDTVEKQEKWWNTFLEWRTNFQAVQWCAFSKDDNRFIGLFTIKELDLNNRRGELGYSLTKTEYGKGFATEGASSLVAYAFKEIDLHTLFAQILPYNKASQGIIKKLNFREEARFVQSHFFEGTYYDVLQFTLLNPAH